MGVAWLRRRLSQRLPRGCGLFVATNLADGARAPGLAPLCASAASDAAGTSGGGGDGAGFNCSDLQTLGAKATPAWRALLGRSNLSEPTAALLLEQAVSSLAGRGFFATSKFCGPAGFRRSTFSEGVALRWAVQHDDAPLCAHAMQHALLQGMAPHGAQVY